MGSELTETSQFTQQNSKYAQELEPVDVGMQGSGKWNHSRRSSPGRPAEDEASDPGRDWEEDCGLKTQHNPGEARTENTCLLTKRWDSSPFLHSTLRTQQLGLLSDFLLQPLSTEWTREEARDFLSS